MVSKKVVTFCYIVAIGDIRSEIKKFAFSLQEELTYCFIADIAEGNSFQDCIQNGGKTSNTFF